jgi:type IX secretion system PorP/SprF family membrane protein
MKKLFVIGLLLLTSSGAFSQQDAIYSQYMFNPFAINPAYAGSRQSISTVMLFRNQWLGIEGAPQTATVAAHAPFKGRNFALGLNLSSEKIGPGTNGTAQFTYAYHLKMAKGKLSFGLRAGIYSVSLDRNLLNYNDPNDRFDVGGQINESTFNADFGMYYYTNNFYAGLSTTHLGGQTIPFDDGTVVTNFNLKQHYMFATGAAIELDRTVFKPSILVKYVATAPVNVDINASFLFNKMFWLGASYRTEGSVVLITEYNVTDFMRIGYSYDVILNALKRFNRGTHELFIGFDFDVTKTKVISPRYL